MYICRNWFLRVLDKGSVCDLTKTAQQHWIYMQILHAVVIRTTHLNLHAKLMYIANLYKVTNEKNLLLALN